MSMSAGHPDEAERRRREQMLARFGDSFAEPATAEERIRKEFAEFAHPDLEWIEDPAWPGAGTFHGFDEVIALRRERLDSFDYEQTVERVLHAGDTMVGLVRWRGRAQSSGAEAEMQMAIIWTFRGDKVARVQFVIDHEKALRIAGIDSDDRAPDDAAAPIEVVRRLHAAFDEVGMRAVRDALSEVRDPVALAEALGEPGTTTVELVDPSIEVELSGQDFSLPEGPTFHGYDGWIAFWREWLEPWDHFEYTLDNFAVAGEDVLLDLAITARGRHSGVPVELRVAQVWTVRNGRIVRLRVFDTREDAERAVGGTS
jgi:ketosteroid isomerase-like protein